MEWLEHERCSFENKDMAAAIRLIGLASVDKHFGGNTFHKPLSVAPPTHTESASEDFSGWKNRGLSPLLFPAYKS